MSILPTLLIASATGARTMAGLAATARSLASDVTADARPEPARFLAQPQVAAGLATLAAMEIVADKLPFVGDRTDPGPLFGRVVAGGAIGAALAARGGSDRARGALVGAAAAFVGAHLAFQLRRELAEWLPAPVAGLVEDSAVAAVVVAGVKQLRAIHPREGEAPT